MNLYIRQFNNDEKMQLRPGSKANAKTPVGD